MKITYKATENAVGDFIKSYREELNISQSTLANRLGISSKTLSAVEVGSIENKYTFDRFDNYLSSLVDRETVCVDGKGHEFMTWRRMFSKCNKCGLIRKSNKLQEEK